MRPQSTPCCYTTCGVVCCVCQSFIYSFIHPKKGFSEASGAGSDRAAVETGVNEVVPALAEGTKTAHKVNKITRVTVEF